MSRIVMKFGGTSVVDLDRIRNVAARVKRGQDDGETAELRTLRQLVRRLEAPQVRLPATESTPLLAHAQNAASSDTAPVTPTW